MIQRYIAKMQELPKPNKTYVAEEIVVRDADHLAEMRRVESENAALKAQVQRLSAPVSEEEDQWGNFYIFAGHSFNEAVKEWLAVRAGGK